MQTFGQPAMIENDKNNSSMLLRKRVIIVRSDAYGEHLNLRRKKAEKEMIMQYNETKLAVDKGRLDHRYNI